jgi:hypothetical protein
MAPLMHGDYTVAWICALPLEMAAAEVMLDEIHQTLPRPTAGSKRLHTGQFKWPSRCYCLFTHGHIWNHICCDYRFPFDVDFPQVLYALMVGIGGGVPSSSNDIRLGDTCGCQQAGWKIQWGHSI